MNNNNQFNLFFIAETYFEAKNLKDKIESLYKLLEQRTTISDPEEWYPPKAWSTGHVIKTKRFNGETISYKTSYQYVEKEHTIKNAKNWIPPTQDYTLKDLIKLAYLFSARLVLKTDKQAEMDK